MIAEIKNLTDRFESKAEKISQKVEGRKGQKPTN